MHGLTVYAKEGLPFASNLSLENSKDSCFPLALLHLLSFFLFLYWCTNFGVNFIIDEVLLINPISSLFVYGDLNNHHKDCLTYSDLTNSPGEHCYYFSISNNLLKWLTFLRRSLTVTLTVLLFWVYFFLLTLVFLLQWLSLHWEIMVMLLSQFPLTFCKTQDGMSCFIA